MLITEGSYSHLSSHADFDFLKPDHRYGYTNAIKKNVETMQILYPLLHVFMCLVKLKGFTSSSQKMPSEGSI